MENHEIVSETGLQKPRGARAEAQVVASKLANGQIFAFRKCLARAKYERVKRGRKMSQDKKVLLLLDRFMLQSSDFFLIYLVLFRTRDVITGGREGREVGH